METIDLGKLQNALKTATTRYGNAAVQVMHAERAMRRAQIAFDHAVQRADQAEKVLDKMKRAVVEAARAVANG